MNFNQLLEMVGVDPARTVVLRHRPTEKKLRPLIARMAQEQRHLFDAWQGIQDKRVSSSIRKAGYVAAFLALEGDSAVFAGLYDVKGHSKLTQRQFQEMPAVPTLFEMGMAKPKWAAMYWHDLALTDLLAPFRFSLAVRWPGGGRNWVRWANRNVFEVLPLPVHEYIRADMPRWDELDLSWGELKNLPPSWRKKLEEWRGIYCIFDTASKQAYVGAAYGDANIMGRWLNYAKTGHGENEKLKDLDAEAFRFTILQRVSPDMDVDEVLALEVSWKRRLHTREERRGQSGGVRSFILAFWHAMADEPAAARPERQNDGPDPADAYLVERFALAQAPSSLAPASRPQEGMREGAGAERLGFRAAEDGAGCSGFRLLAFWPAMGPLRQTRNAKMKDLTPLT